MPASHYCDPVMWSQSQTGGLNSSTPTQRAQRNLNTNIIANDNDLYKVYNMFCNPCEIDNV